MLSTLPPNGQIIFPLAMEQGWVQQAWKEAHAKGALLRTPIACTNMFARPSCLAHPSRCVHMRLSMHLSTPHFSPAAFAFPRRQGRRASPTSSSHWAKHPLHGAVISGLLAGPLLDLFVCLPCALFVCSLPAELFSACIQYVGWPAPLLDIVSLGCKPVEAAQLSWPPLLSTRASIHHDQDHCGLW